MARQTRSKSTTRVEAKTTDQASKSRVKKQNGSGDAKRTSRGRSKSPAKKATRRGDIENDIVEARPANHASVAEDVRAWNVDESPVHPRRRSSSRGRGETSKSSTRTAPSKGSNWKKIVATCREDLPFPEIYFGGCAFGSAFYCGVYRALYEKYDFQSLLANGLTLSGGSAGACFALYIALGYTPDEVEACYSDVLKNTPASSPWHNSWRSEGASMTMEANLREIFEADKEVYKKIEGIVAIGTTQWYSKHAWHVAWVDNEDLMRTIAGSYHVPFYCHLNHQINGMHVIDGAYGFAGYDLKHGDETLYVGIDPHAEITRHFDYSQMFFPPQGQDYTDIVDSGYEATVKWMGHGKMNKKVGEKGGPAYRTPNWEALRFLWFAKILEVLLYHYRAHLMALVIAWLLVSGRMGTLLF